MNSENKAKLITVFQVYDSPHYSLDPVNRFENFVGTIQKCHPANLVNSRVHRTEFRSIHIDTSVRT